MTFDEYNEKMNSYDDKLSKLCGDERDKFYEEMQKFQQDYMENILNEYEKPLIVCLLVFVYHIETVDTMKRKSSLKER